MIHRNSLFCIAAILSLTFEFTIGNDIKEDERRSHSDREGLWFGPRLGKRHVSEDNSDIYYRLTEAADALRFFYNQLPDSYLERRNEPETRVTKKVIFTPKLGRGLGEEQHFVDFTPRLGKRGPEDMGVTPADQEIYQSDSDRIGSRTRYFSPRLGRTMNFSPRLGRELNYDNYGKVRFVRSTNNTKNSKR